MILPTPTSRWLCGLLACLPLAMTTAEPVTPPPLNVIVIFTDDQGYGDLGCFGSTSIRTPHLDRMAAEGRRLTRFMVASPVCTPSRAALLTGCYPKRVGLHQGVLFPNSRTGLNPAERTIASHLRAAGYATACVGKWHLGHHADTLPTRLVFDSYYGIPYSNDMNHGEEPDKPDTSRDKDALWQDPESAVTRWNTPLMVDEAIAELPTDQRTITRRYTDRAIEFIEANRQRPFFLYLAHSMPHVPLYVPDEVRDADTKRAYINVIEHLDAECGRLLDRVRELDLAGRTLVIFTSDNGPWLMKQHHAGSAGPLRDGKGTNFEGGQRVPCVLWAPGLIPAGTESSALATTLDLLPTIAALTRTPLAQTPVLDGENLAELLTGVGESGRERFLYYSRNGKLGCKEFAFCGRPLKSHWVGPEGGEMGVAGEKGTKEMFPPSPRLRRPGRCVSGRCFGKKNPQSTPVNG